MKGKLWKSFLATMVLTSGLQLQLLDVKAIDKKIEGISADAESANGHAAALAVDGDALTYWQSPDAGSMKDHMRVLNIDLKGLYELSKIQITNKPGSYYHYEVYASETGAKYDKVAFKADNKLAQASDSYTINGKRARYLRINVSYNSAQQDVNLAEVEAFGTLITKDEAKQEPIKTDNFAETSWGKEYAKFESDQTYANEKTIKEAYNLVGRVIGDTYKSKFQFELRNAGVEGKDVFEVEQKDGKIIVRGNNGVSLASGFNYYLKTYAKVDYNPLFGSNVKMPKELPNVEGKIIKDTQYDFRYALNFCTYSYTMSFWSWKEYEEFIDWGAMNGVNLMLDIVGQEEVLRRVFTQYGYSDKEIKDYISGPAYFAWFYMQNMYGLGGPLPNEWFTQRVELGRQIHDRMQAYGIDPVMQGFGGQVPVDFEKKNPDAAVINPGGWPGFQRPYMVKTYLTDADKAAGKKDYFSSMADVFYDTQDQVFGNTSKFYAVDPFHEGGNTAGLDLIKIYQEVQKKMIENDEEAVWVMQQWQNGINEQKLSGLFKKDQALVLDLQSDIRSQASPMENQDVPWIWNMLHNFGGRMGLDGEPQNISQNITEAYNNSDYMVGIGITPESINNSPMVYELLFDMTWTQDPINYRTWVQEYAERRYGGTTPEIVEAWEILLETAYRPKEQYYQGASESVINAKPADKISAASTWGHSTIMYDKKAMEKVIPLFAASYDKLKDSEGFMYDFVDVTKQLLANSAQEYHPLMVEAYNAKDKAKFDKISTQFLDIIRLQERVLATSPYFMTGTWVEQSRNMIDGADDWTKDLFEFNARSLITTWGPQKNAQGGGLDDYSNRQWAGLTGDYYLPRWEKWVDDRKTALENSSSPVSNNWFMNGWEWANRKSDQGFALDSEVSNDNLKELANVAYDQFSVSNMDSFISSTTQPEKVNLALGKEVTASVASANGSSTALVTDGDRFTGWKAADGIRKGSLVVDLGAVNQVSGIEFALQQIANTFPLTYSIDVFDGTTWKDKVAEDVSGGITSKNEIDYTGLASKVRFNFETSDGSDLPDIKELMVYGTAQEKPNYVNLALSATAQGSASKPSPEDVSKINDGNDSTNWVSAGGAVPAWVSLTLPEKQYVDKAILRFEKGQLDRSYEFVVKAINNGVERVVFERTTADLTKPQDIVNEIPIQGEIDSLRIDIKAAKVPSSGGNAWPLIAEVELLQEQEKTLPTTNIALNKTVTSSTKPQSGKGPANVVDGKTDTLWISDGGVMPTDIKVDLEKDTSVTHTKLIFEKAGLKFKIIVEAIDEKGNVTELLNLDKNHNGLEKEYTLPINKSIRYVRVKFTGTSDPNATPWPALGELEIYSLPENVTSKAEVTTSTGVDAQALKDGDPTTGVTLQGAGEKTVDFKFDKAYDLNAYELIKSSIVRAQNPAKYKISYANGNDDYKVISDNTGNTVDKDRLLDEFDKTIFADRIRFTFINDTITIQEIKLFEANVSKSLDDYITSVEKQLAKVKIGAYAGNYSKEAKDIMDAAVAQARIALDAGVNSQQATEEISKLQKALTQFYKTGYIVIDRNPIKVELDKAAEIEKALRSLSFEELANEVATSIASARTVHDTYKVTQAEIKGAADTLALKTEEVLSTLTIAQQFNVLATTVETTLTQAVVGDKDNQVAQVDKDALSDALALAKVEIVKGDDVAKRGVIDTLQAALDTFHTKRIVINRDALRKTITELENIEEKLYDKTQWNDFVTALAQAKEVVDADVNQASIDASIASLEAAQQKLILLDRSALEAAIATYESLQKELYTEDSWGTFEKTLQNVTKLANATSVSQKELEEGVQSLKDAANALVKVLDKKGLEQAIATAKKLQRTDYTTASWQNMQAALTLAQDALENATTQSAIDQAFATLLSTMDQLVKVEQGGNNGGNSGSGSGSGSNGSTGGSGSTNTGDTTKAGFFIGSIIIAGGAVLVLRKKAKNKV